MTTIGVSDREESGAVGSGLTPVLVVSRSNIVSGAERVLISLAPEMAHLGYEMVLGCPPGSPFGEIWSELGLQTIDLPAPSYGGLRRPGSKRRPSPAKMATDADKMLSSAKHMASLAAEYSLVHSNSLWGHLEAAVAGRLARRPVVLHLHDMVLPGFGRYVLGAAVGMSSAAVAISQAVASCVPAFARSRVVVQPNGIDHHRFSPDHPEGSLPSVPGPVDSPLVGIVGRIDPEKGVHEVVRAVARLQERGLRPRLVVAGEPTTSGDYYDRVHAEATLLLGDRVSFLGQVSDASGLMAGLDVLVNASRSEPFGMTILEAQACGTPVVAAAGGGAVEIVEDGVTGLLFPPGDDAALAGAISQILENPSLARSLSTSARDRVVEQFGIQAAAARLARLYASLVRPGPLPKP